MTRSRLWSEPQASGVLIPSWPLTLLAHLILRRWQEGPVSAIAEHRRSATDFSLLPGRR